jgi:hypothetical protein
MKKSVDDLFADFDNAQKEKWHRDHPYYNPEDDPDFLRAKNIIKDYLDKDPFLLTFLNKGIDTLKDDPNLTWLWAACLDNPYINKLYSKEVTKWYQFPEIHALRVELLYFLCARMIDRFGGEKEFFVSFGKNGNFLKIQTPEACKHDYYIAQKLFRKRFEKLLRKYGII